MVRLSSQLRRLALVVASLVAGVGVFSASTALAADTTADAPSGQSAAPPAAAAGPTDEAAEVIITGTRRRDRTVADSAAPIDVVTGSDLANQPTSNMLDTLTNLIPAFVVGQNPISDASSFVRSPSLRGLPSDEMLVMLNGKRMNRSALVQVYQGGETELAFGSQGPDLASIPAISVRSLEVLRDGASAQYGSDAIAGVLNYQFRTESRGVQVMGRYGEYFPGSQWSNDGKDRLVAINFGLPLSSEGFANFSAEYANNDQTVRNVTRPSALALAETYPNLAAGLPHYPGPVQQWGTPPSESFKGLLNAGVTLSNSDQLYFLVNYAHINTNESFNYRLPLTVTGGGVTFSHHPAFGDIYLDACSANPTFVGCPTGGYISQLNGAPANTFNFTSVYPSGFTPRFYGTTSQMFANLGYKGTTGYGMTYDLSGTFAQNSLTVGLRNTLNPSLGPQSPTNFYDGKFQQQEATFNFDVTYPWAVSALAKPISVAAGLEWHDELYQQFLGDQASYAAGPYTSQPLYTCTGTTCIPTLNPDGSHMIVGQSTASNGYGGISTSVDASQHNYAAYVDLEADVLSNLTLGIAGRYEDYQSFGSTTLGKFSARLRVTDWLALRGTVSNGFHAPTPGQSNVETLSTTFIPGTANQQQIGTYPVSSPIAQYYGAVPLKPEKSKNFSAGIVLTPIERMLLTIDGYKIKVTDRIGITSTFTVTPADIAKLPALAYVGPGGTVQYFTNGFDTDTKGVDVVGTYHFNLGPGTLATTLAYNYNKTTVPNYNPNVISASRIIDIQHYAPNDRVNLGLEYAVGRFTARLQENYYGSWRDENDYPGQLFGAKFTTDLDFAYTVWKDITLAIGGKNITNTYPDKIANSSVNTVYASTGGLIDGQVYPRTGGPFGFNGAFYYIRLDAKFWGR